ncbi:MAG TPA: efflux RND transporter permease subunit [Candidatus Sulfotelmatobacter sp.]|nr:efflux RND transporter permease subunit [Candidatus Sulfotelmatobacter sp.]
MPKFFIDRPVFAWVISIFIMLAGIMAIIHLPIAEYPNVAPPSVTITATYLGASAETVQNTVTEVIEEQMSGLDHLLYMSSSSSSSGQSQVSLYFQPGTDPDIAQVDVQNKLQLAIPSLPATVQQQGLVVAKSTRNFLMFFTLSSTNGNLDAIALGNYIQSTLFDPVSRVNGVGEADLFGSQYAMRIWLDPDKLKDYSISPATIISAVEAQNSEVPVGQLGMLPAVNGQEINITLQGQSTLRTTTQFGNIVLRVNQNGSRVYLRDVSRIELGGQTYTFGVRANGRPCAAVGIRLEPGANALATADAVRAKVAQLSRFFPPGVVVTWPYDSTEFIRASINEVVKTLIEAIIMVFLILYFFLQNLRTAFIPTIVVPVALLGSFAIMQLLGFSINVLTMFGLVLAIGILVDDAIVVTENVERIMNEEGLSPRDATRKAMGQITGALIAISLVLTAVFIPMAFFGGSVGAIYRQFSLSLVSCMGFSIFLAMSLTPALCASMLKPVEKGHHFHKRGFWGWFNRNFDATTHRYEGWVSHVLKRSPIYLGLYLLIVGAVGWLFVKLPSSFLPAEDQGYFINMIQLPVGATQERTVNVLKKMEHYYFSQPQVQDVIDVAGFSFAGQGQNSALAFVHLKPWSERPGPENAVSAIIGNAFVNLGQIPDAIIFPLNPPPIPELGIVAGFDMELEDQGGLGHDKLMDARRQLIALAAKDPNVAQVQMQALEDTPELKIDVDLTKASAMGVSPADLNTTLTTCFGSFYINNFINGNRVQHVVAQLDAPYRMLPQDLDKVYVQAAGTNMAPLSEFVKTHWINASPSLQSYNGFPAIELTGSAPPGKSIGQAMDAMEKLVQQLPRGIGFEWTGQSFEELLSSEQAPVLLSLSILVVFLALAALYENWSIPLAVILVIPLGVIGALLGARARELPNDVFFKVGLLTIIGLSAKNAILIVEFAKDMQAQGVGLIEATLAGARLRLRPILMTSLAFILGVMPMAVSTGAGAASRHDMGTGVIGGMLSATLLAIFLVPAFYVTVRRIFKGKIAPAHESLMPTGTHDPGANPNPPKP